MIRLATAAATMALASLAAATGVQAQDASVSAFIDEVAAPVNGNRTPARWAAPICVQIENLPVEPAQYVVDRISQIAAALGLEIGEPGCTPTINIVATPDGAQTARAWVESAPKSFNPGVQDTIRGADELNDFMISDRPVRWWQVSAPVDSRNGRRMVALPGEEGFSNADRPVAMGDIGGGSRLSSQSRDDILKTWVVVDVSKLEGADWASLADYIAVVSLAQIDPHADTAGYDTVLNLFSDPDGAKRLTRWDLSYLKALYETEPGRTPRVRFSDMASRMTQLQEEAAGE